MSRWSALLGCALLLAPACGDDEDSSSTTSTSAATDPGTTTGDTTSSTGDTTGSTGSTTDPGTTDPSTTTADPSTTTGDPSTSGGSTGQDLMCDPVVPGDWAPCYDGQEFNLTGCNFEAGVGNGTLNCLTSNSNPAASVCLIEGCVDACDCFAPPSTGNATVICEQNGDTTGCALGCAQGQTCPDGMQCLDGVCYHVP